MFPTLLGSKNKTNLLIPERGFLVAKFGVLLYIWGTKDLMSTCINQVFYFYRRKYMDPVRNRGREISRDPRFIY